jgi:O-antigen ligase
LMLPFGINYTLLIVIWSVLFLLFNSNNNDLKKVFENKWSYVLISFFLIHAFGYFFSENKAVALFAIEKKLGFLLFPLFLYSTSYSEKQLNRIISGFIAACSITSLFCFFRIIYRYFNEGATDFFYKEFSWFIHPSYFAMYLLFAFMLLLLVMKDKFREMKSTHLVSLSVLFLVSIYFCSSKMGLISALLLVPVTLIVSMKVNLKIILAGISLIILSLFVTNKFFPEPFVRINVAMKVMFSKEAINKNDVESTAVRILIWEESIKIIKENFIFGTTPGDLTDRMNTAYQQSGMTGAYANSLNAHNQFLQTFIGTGLIGFIVLVIMTFYAFFLSLIRKYFLLALFSLMVILNFMVESMLQVHAGFIFFVFFFCLMTRYDLSKRTVI